MPAFVDIVGERHGRLVVARYVYSDKRGQANWECRCDCGNTRILTTTTFRRNKSCGCWQKEARHIVRRNLTGQRFGRLVVLGIGARRLDRTIEQIVFVCLCCCGRVATVTPNRLQSGNTKSCGCIRKERDLARRPTPGKKKADQKRWASTRRARERNLPAMFPDAHYQFMIRYWHYQCAICGNEEGFLWTIAADHFIPITALECPGTVIDNMLPLCHGRKGVRQIGIVGCNSSKWNKDPIVWLTAKLGPRKAKFKLQEIEAYFVAARAFAVAAS